MKYLITLKFENGNLADCQYGEIGVFEKRIEELMEDSKKIGCKIHSLDLKTEENIKRTIVNITKYEKNTLECVSFDLIPRIYSVIPLP